MNFTPETRARVGVLISGRGSNLGALIAATRAGGHPAEIVAVISNRADAAGLELAREAGIAATVIDHKAHESRGRFEDAMTAVLEEARVDIVCNAGFMRLLTTRFTDRWRDRQLNIHPSLLPAYKGLHTHERALADGVRITGCTVHVVREEMDEGPIVAQAAVAVAQGDTPETLAARVLAAEHRLYPHALALFASGRARVVGERIELEAGDGEAAPLFAPPHRTRREMTVEDLIAAREVAGLRLSLKVHIVVPLVIASVQGVFFQRNDVATLVTLFVFTSAVSLALLWVLTRARARLVGIALVLIDVLLMVEIPLAWYTGIGELAGSRAFFYQLPMFAVFSLILTFSALPLRPLYVAATGTGAVAAHVGYWLWIVADPNVTVEPLDKFVAGISSVASERLAGGVLMLSLTAAVLLAITMLARRATLEASEQQKHAQLSRYFSPAVARQIESGDGSESALDEAEKDVIVMMTDIRGFTALSARIGPRASVALLSDYFDRMVPPVFANHGTVDKFLGDSVLAVFGAPISTGRDADDALAAAAAMTRGLAAWNAERQARGEAAIAHVIALHAGPAIVGTVGSAGRKEYTVVGDTVNGASRILGIAKAHDARLLASRAFVDRLSAPPPVTAEHSAELRGLGRLTLLELSV